MANTDRNLEHLQENDIAHTFEEAENPVHNPERFTALMCFEKFPLWHSFESFDLHQRYLSLCEMPHNVLWVFFLFVALAALFGLVVTVTCLCVPPPRHTVFVDQDRAEGPLKLYEPGRVRYERGDIHKMPLRAEQEQGEQGSS